jgi:hypothetical protein
LVGSFCFFKQDADDRDILAPNVGSEHNFCLNEGSIDTIQRCD